MNNRKQLIDHSAIDIEAEIQKFLNNGGQIVNVSENHAHKNYEKAVKNFYRTKEWKQKRNLIVEKFKLSNSYKCNVCGREEDLCVDHIKPIKHFWDLRLEDDNLQILCTFCNLNKGSEINWNLDTAKENFSIDIDSYKRKKDKEEFLLELYSASAGLNSTDSHRLSQSYLNIKTECEKLKLPFMNVIEYRYFVRNNFDYNFYTKLPKNLHTNIIELLSRNNINIQQSEEQNSTD